VADIVDELSNVASTATY